MDAFISTILGFLVDLTPPNIIELFDGPNLHRDESYQTSISQLSASWIMVDPESGILEYRLSIASTFQGTTTHFYPPNSPDITIQPQEIGESGVLTCWSDDDIQLSSGTLYTIKLTPVNRANLSTVYTSSGITPDNSPPVMEFIHIDTYGDESEEKTEENAVSLFLIVYKPLRGLRALRGVLHYRFPHLFFYNVYGTIDNKNVQYNLPHTQVINTRVCYRWR